MTKPNLSNEKKAHTSIMNMMQHAINEKVKIPSWSYQFRASSIPVCQWYVCLSKIYKNYPADLPPDSTGFLFDYFVTVGTAVHTVYQRWLGRFGYLYGHFKCTTCGAMEKNRLGWPEKCPTEKCEGNNWEYVELSLHDAVMDIGLKSAHCDGLLHFDWMEPDTYYLVDFKTCSLKTLPSPKERFKEEHHIKYLTQTGFYHYILTKMGYKIIGTIFLMIPRDKPTQSTPIIYDQSSMAERIFHSVAEEYKQAEEAAVLRDMTSITQACHTANDKPDCPFNEVCFNKREQKSVFDKLKIIY